ncbi:hypothetical protein CEQ90_20415 [Lewinellaceae bacterium SD302]|nr:hypothetical protein CEQ90_20415 [Lewinellaceae bacterium SD302]
MNYLIQVLYLIILVPSIKLGAQEISYDSTYKWCFSINLLPIIATDNYLTTTTLNIRKKISKKSNIRLTIGNDLSFGKGDTESLTDNFIKRNSSNFYLALGLELQPYNLNNNGSFYIGTQVTVVQKSNKTESLSTLQQGQDTIIYNLDFSKLEGIGLVNTLGYSYQINNRIAISIEAVVPVIYKNEKKKNRIVINNAVVEENNYNSLGIIARIDPVGGIYFSYRF